MTGSRGRDPDLGGERGSVTAELALALPAVVLALLLGAGALGAASRQVALQDAAADAARLLGRGEDADAAARAVGASGATLTDCSLQGFVATVEVQAAYAGLAAVSRARAGPPEGP